MTNKEARKLIEIVRDCGGYRNSEGHRFKDAFNLAIDALEKQIPKKPIANLWDEWQECSEYWVNITTIFAQQQEKGLKTYGQRLEENTAPSIQDRLTYLQEELVDGLMYTEWVKDIMTEQDKEVQELRREVEFLKKALDAKTEQLHSMRSCKDCKHGDGDVCYQCSRRYGDCYIPTSPVNADLKGETTTNE